MSIVCYRYMVKRYYLVGGLGKVVLKFELKMRVIDEGGGKWLESGMKFLRLVDVFGGLRVRR